ncbi:RNA polymerase sigma-70 factor [Parabacteroides chinchillae]|uniref:RNA polymerase sigma-70 factor, ECF subfamily n=1 Tax=Parabacteroides chinchillae TaxID=871327 RepID=A0A8G2BYG6_9BACT|nr:RNA polymerase sigma-70 factor [Parabacteroides chinchillae]SEG19393.1 RNA polymerase sigma-70 factor, ECF subfamily [Parabacteroides chinchillae]
MEEQQTDMRLFSILFEKYKEPFTLFANSYIRDRVVSEDIYVEAMMHYWEKRHELPSDTNIPAYILTSVKNKALNHLRHLDVKTEAEELLLSHSVRELNFRISSLESCDPSELFTTEMREIIRKALGELPEQSRLIFRKSRFENKTNRKIAEELDINIKTVEYHISKTQKILRLRLKDYLPLLIFLDCF